MSVNFGHIPMGDSSMGSNIFDLQVILTRSVQLVQKLNLSLGRIDWLLCQSTNLYN